MEMLTLEYIEEVVDAGGARLMTSDDLAEFISELVVNNLDESCREAARPEALQVAQMLLLPEECRRRGIEVDAGTVEKLRRALK